MPEINEIDTVNTDRIVCPYCNKAMGINDSIKLFYSKDSSYDESFDMDCEKCEKTFSLTVSLKFSSEKN